MTTDTRDIVEPRAWFRGRTRSFRETGLGLLRRPLILYLIAIPNLVAIVYFGLIASPVYISRAALRVVNPASNASSLTSMLSGGSGDGSSEGAFILKTYLNSWDAFREIDSQLDLARHYSSGDLVSAYGGLMSLFSESDVALWHYYQNHVGVDVDVKSGIASIKVDGFSSAFASRLAGATLQTALNHLNRMNLQEVRDMTGSAQSRQTALQDAVRNDEVALARYRGKIGMYDPRAEYTSQLSLQEALAAKDAEYRSQYASLKAATPNSPDALNIAAALSALQAKKAEADRRIAKLESDSAGYDALVARRDSDLAMLRQASLALLQAQQKASENLYYLSVVSGPSAPATPEAPHRLYWVLGTMIGSFLIWGLLR